MPKVELLSKALSRRHLIKAGGILASGIAAPSFLNVRSAFAAYPERPVKILVSNTPGGPSDIVARIVAQALQESTGKIFIVENRGGAGGNIGMGYVARSEPDGYTILLATSVYSINVSLFKDLPYDPYKDFVGVSEVATSPNTFVIRSDLPAKSMKEFVALAREGGEKFNVSTGGQYTTLWIQAELLKIREKLPQMANVVFRGGGDALQAVLGGTVQLCSSALPPAYPHIKAGTLRCLAVTGETRWPDLPDVPTMTELGYQDFVFATDAVLLAPAKTPPQVVKWLETEMLTCLSKQDMKEKLYRTGFQVRAKGGDAAWARVTKEIGMFKAILDQTGIQKQ
jgi:tripartite-type tricarboxylate transporter receptor subunit TctC